MRILPLLLTLFITGAQIRAQVLIPPKAYWTFEGTASEALQDRTGQHSFSGTEMKGLQETGGPVGQYVKLEKSGGRPVATGKKIGQLWNPYRMTVEMLLKPGPEFSTGVIFELEGRLKLFLSDLCLEARVNFADGSRQTFRAPLQGIDRASPDRIFDGNWHHLVFMFNGKTGNGKFYLDGICPDEFSITLKAKKTPIPQLAKGAGIRLSGRPGSQEFAQGAQIDELAFYPRNLPAEYVWQHYQEAILQGQHYSYTLTAKPADIPLIAQKDLLYDGINLLEFPPQYSPGTPNLSTLDLMAGFPRPRFQRGHDLPRIKCFFSGPNSWGGSASENKATRARNAAYLMKSLALDFNYSYLLGDAYSAQVLDGKNLRDPNHYLYYSLPLADSLYEAARVPRCVLSNWSLAQAQFTGGADHSSNVKNFNLPDSIFFQDGKTGKRISRRLWATHAVGNPYYDGLLEADGKVQFRGMKMLLDQLQTPLIHAVIENGEVFHPMDSASKAFKDPRTRRDFQKSGLNTWREYEARQRYRQREEYVSAFLKPLDAIGKRSSGDPQFRTELVYYNVAGKTGIVFEYAPSAAIHDSFGGYRRPTPYFYPPNATMWRYHHGQFSSWKRIIEHRIPERAAGDSLFNPFVSPGFDNSPAYKTPDPERMRPGPYLGMLKALMMLGADTYTPFVDNPKEPGTQVTWQMVMPAYAQAVGTRVAEFLREGTLLQGDPRFIFDGSGSRAHSAFTFNTGNPNDLVLVRRSPDGKRYLILATAQRLSNTRSQGSKTREIQFFLPFPGAGLQDSIRLMIRPQGSTYIFEPKPSGSVLYQLDEWHDWKDPWYWAREDFCLQAENPSESMPAGMAIRTERPVAAGKLDFSEFTSYVVLPAQTTPDTLQYDFMPLDQQTRKMWVRVRKATGTNGGNLYVKVDGQASRQLNVRNPDWQWLNLDPKGNALQFTSPQAQLNRSLQIWSRTGNIEIDRILLSPNGQNPNSFSPKVNIEVQKPRTYRVGDTLTFKVSSQLATECADYTWTFGDGTQDYLPGKVRHVFSNPGTYTVKLKVQELCTNRVVETSMRIKVFGK